MGNQLISFRLNPEIVSAIAQRYPGLSPSEGCKSLLLETLGLSASPMPKPGLDEIYQRLERLEARVFSLDDTPVSTPNDTLMTLDDTLQTPELSSNDTDDTLLTPDDTVSTPVDTLLTPDDIKGIILGILKDSEINSLAKILAVLKARGIKIPSPRGAAKPTNQNIKPFLPDWWVKG